MLRPVVKGWLTWTEAHIILTLDDVLDMHLLQEVLEEAEAKNLAKDRKKK